MSAQHLDCPEVIGKTVKSLQLYPGSNSFEEMLLEFTDGTSFSASYESRIAVNASLIRTGCAAPEVLKRYTE